jgi:hypothetical protein
VHRQVEVEDGRLFQAHPRGEPAEVVRVAVVVDVVLDLAGEAADDDVGSVVAVGPE